MTQNFSNYQYPTSYPQTHNADAVSINIYAPAAYANGATAPTQAQGQNFYSMYGTNTQPNLPLYPANYNNSLQNNGNGSNNIYNYNTPQMQPVANNVTNNTVTNEAPKAAVNNIETPDKTDKTDKKDKDKETKTITPLSDDYIKTIENYLNDSNPKTRLIGAKAVAERFKEDDSRKDNPSLTPLLNKMLQDTSSPVRFLALTTLQLDYANGDNKTVELLKQIQTDTRDKIGEDQLLASEILLKMSAPEKVKVEGDKA